MVYMTCDRIILVLGRNTEPVPSGYEGVTMQAALDMQSGVVLDPMAEFFALGQHPDQGREPAIGVTALTLSVKKGGGKAAYAPGCTDTDAVGMACEQVTGVRLYVMACFCLFPLAKQ